MAKAEVKKHNGTPAIFIDGKVYPPMAATIRTNCRDHMNIDREYYRRFGESGIKLYFLICDTEWLKPGALEQFREEAEILLEEVPDAYIILRIGLHPPISWCESNPDELVRYSDGSLRPNHLYTESYEAEYPAMYSLCSDKWRQDAGKALMETYDAVEALPYADRIVGYFLAAGNTSEWYYLDTDQADGSYPGFSPAFRREFTRYLTTKYGSDEALNEAWRTAGETLDNPTIPPQEERDYFWKVEDQIFNPGTLYSTSPKPAMPKLNCHVGAYLDVDKSLRTLDFLHAWHLGTANSVVHFASLIKKRSKYKLTGAFYGSHNHGGFSGVVCGVQRILDSGVVDFLAAPGDYRNRQVGGFCGHREVVDAFTLRNCMYIMEEDTRTHAENTYYSNFNEIYDMDDTINVMKRDFGRNLCEDMNAWWFDQHIGGGRYKYEEVYSLISRQQRIAARSYELDRRKRNEIAFIFDEETPHCVSALAHRESVEDFRDYEISRIGLSGDRYYHEDLANPDMPDYKLYVFVDCHVLTAAERDAIHAKLSKNHATAVWMCASGLIDPDAPKRLDPAHVGELTGIRMRMEDTYISPKFKFLKDGHPAFAALDTHEIYGFSYRPMLSVTGADFCNRYYYLSPVVVPEEMPDVMVAARFCETGWPSVVVKDCGSFTSIFVSTRSCSADFFREAARYAGCHVFCDSDDVIYASRNYVTIHASSSGEKTLRFPSLCSPFEVYEEREYAENTDNIVFTMHRGETKTFAIFE